jgi:multidrug efflux pump subunit AcrB
VEQEIVRPVEDALSSVSNVKKITSTASYEQARIGLELDFEADADLASIEATKKVEAIKNRLPEEADSPVVIKRDLNAKPIVELAVLSPYGLSDTYVQTENVFQEVLQQAGGVSEVELHGGRDKEVAVEADRDKVAAYGLSLDKIASAIKKENQLLPSGSVYTESTQSDVRLIAQYRSVAEIEQVQVEGAGGRKVPLTAVATVREQSARSSRYGRLNGQDAINVLVYKNSDANVVETAKNIGDRLERLRRDYSDYEFVLVSSDADYVETSLHNTVMTLVEGLITTGLVLFFFLRGWRSTAAVMIAIPTSLIATFFVMYVFGFTFNMMSLMGMTLCIGICRSRNVSALNVAYGNKASLFYLAEGFCVNLKPFKPHGFVVGNLNLKAASRTSAFYPADYFLIISKNRLCRRAKFLGRTLGNIRRICVQSHAKRTKFCRRFL